MLNLYQICCYWIVSTTVLALPYVARRWPGNDQAAFLLGPPSGLSGWLIARLQLERRGWFLLWLASGLLLWLVVLLLALNQSTGFPRALIALLALLAVATAAVALITGENQWQNRGQLCFAYSLVGSFLLAPKPSDADAVAGLYGLMLILAIGAILLGVLINKNAERPLPLARDLIMGGGALIAAQGLLQLLTLGFSA